MNPMNCPGNRFELVKTATVQTLPMRFPLNRTVHHQCCQISFLVRQEKQNHYHQIRFMCSDFILKYISRPGLTALSHAYSWISNYQNTYHTTFSLGFLRFSGPLSMSACGSDTATTTKLGVKAQKITVVWLNTFRDLKLFARGSPVWRTDRMVFSLYFSLYWSLLMSNDALQHLLFRNVNV